MYSKILVPLDGSKLSEGILPYARALARAIELPVEILSVHDAATSSADDASLVRREYLAEVAKSFAVADVKYTLAVGDPAGTIVYLAAAQPGALITMATHGYSGARRWLLGSVAEKVLQATQNHLLLVRPAEAKPAIEARIKTVLVPLDGSPLAEAVLPIVRELALRLKLEVVLVRVLAQVYFAVADDLLPMAGMNMAGQKEIRGHRAEIRGNHRPGHFRSPRTTHGKQPVGNRICDRSVRWRRVSVVASRCGGGKESRARCRK